MADDDINIDPALSHPPSSVVSDLTPLASPALSSAAGFPSRPPSRLNNAHGLLSRHSSPDIAVPATHVTENGSSSGQPNTNSSNNDVPVPPAAPAPSNLPPKQPTVAGVKRKVDDSSIMKCPYRESNKCKKEYKHKNGRLNLYSHGHLSNLLMRLYSAMRYHLEQAHAQEPDIQQRLSDFPAQPASKKAKTSTNKTSYTTQSSNNNTSNNSKLSTQRSNLPPPPPTTTAPNPFFGLFTHGYVFSSSGLPFRPHNRPIDALYYLNILSTAGIKSQQQRASERLMINALLNADFIKHLQDNVNSSNSMVHSAAYQQYHQLDLLDEKGMIKPPVIPIQPSTSMNYGPYSKRDADSAILKLAKTLQDVGLGDGIDNAQYF